MAWPRAAPGLPGGAGQRPLQGVDLRALVLHLGRPVVELLLRLGRLLQGGGGRALAGRGVTVGWAADGKECGAVPLWSVRRAVGRPNARNRGDVFHWSHPSPAIKNVCLPAGSQDQVSGGDLGAL